MSKRVTRNSGSHTNPTSEAIANKTGKKRTKREEDKQEEVATAKERLSSKVAKLNSDQEEADVKENKTSRFWLMKSEPESRIENGHEMKFGLDDLKASQNQTTHWDGVRNFEARNHMKSMRVGDQAFFYHSNCKNPGLVAIMRVCKENYVDHTQFDTKDAHYDPKSDPKNPKWFMVDVKFERDLKRFIPLSELKSIHLEHKKEGKGALINLSLFTRSRLSVQSIRKEEWDFILGLENEKKLN
jgi:predicted RNA-binding protein with PUA-like domain